MRATNQSGKKQLFLGFVVSWLKSTYSHWFDYNFLNFHMSNKKPLYCSIYNIDMAFTFPRMSSISDNDINILI